MGGGMGKGMYMNIDMHKVYNHILNWRLLYNLVKSYGAIFKVYVCLKNNIASLNITLL